MICSIKADLINTFSSSASQGHAAFFLGAGISRRSSLPSFMELLAGEAKKTLNIQSFEAEHCPDIAQFLVNKYSSDSESEGKEKLHEYLKERIIGSAESGSNDYLESIVKSNVNTIWTTNYDHLIEEHMRKFSKKYIVKSSEQDYQTSFACNGEVEILKIHGDIDSKELVITRNDYDEFNAKNGLTIKRLENDLLTKSFLFIGYSYNDPDIKNIVNSVRLIQEYSKNKHLIENKHFLILEKEKNLERIDYQNLWVEDLKRYNIHTYVYDNQDGTHSALKGILKEIEHQSKGKSVYVTGSHKDNSSSIALELGKKLASNDKIVMNYGLSKGIGESSCCAFVQCLVSNQKRLKERLAVFANPYVFCTDWDDKDFLLDDLLDLRNSLFESSQIIVAFPGGKGTIQEIELARRKGCVIIPVFGKDSEFGKAVKHVRQIFDDLKYHNSTYYQKITDDVEHVSANDIYNCIKEILNV